jgi:hypothetical protein
MKKKAVVSMVLMVGTATLACLAQACSGGDAGTDSSSSNVTSNPSPTTPTKPGSTTGGAAAPSAGPGSSAGQAPSLAFTVKDAVALEDDTSDDQGRTTPRARVLLSNSKGLCDRINDGLAIGFDETIVSLWYDAATFSVGNQTFDKDATTKHAGAGFAAGKAVCDQTSTGTPDKGSGTFEIESVGATVSGKLDVTFSAGRVTTTFEASACPKKQTHGIANCGGGDAVPSSP